MYKKTRKSTNLMLNYNNKFNKIPKFQNSRNVSASSARCLFIFNF